MTKISEQIKYYKEKIPKTEFDSYFGDPYVSAKIHTLEHMQRVIGDVNLSEDYLKGFLFGFKSFPFRSSAEEQDKKIRIIYELSKDMGMSKQDLLTLIKYYDKGMYSLKFIELRELIHLGKDLESGIKKLRKEAIEYGLEESQKLDYLKEEYSEKFIEKLKKVVKEYCISSERVLEILPSKDFIEKSITIIPIMDFAIKTGEDFVYKRLIFQDIEESYLEALPTERIEIGISAYGDRVYTTFTKAEYEEDLKSQKILTRKK